MSRLEEIQALIESLSPEERAILQSALSRDAASTSVGENARPGALNVDAFLAMPEAVCPPGLSNAILEDRADR